MKILFVMSHVGVFRHFDGVVRELCSRGHTVKILRAPVSKPNITDRALLACHAEAQGSESDWMLQRADRWRCLLSGTRELLSYANYFRPEQAASALADRWKRNLPRPVRIAIKNGLVKKLLTSKMARQSLRRLENIAPPDSAVTRWLESNQPSVVIASPFIGAFSQELEYVKAAKALGIPTAVAVASWDNLTTKGTFHIIPDMTLVWNRALLEEATELHDVPSEKISVTGAPSFDSWFEMKPSSDRSSFCARVGIKPDRPFAVYLCSSKSIAGDETAFAKDLVSNLSHHRDTRYMSILVRPHPLNASIWNGFSANNVVIWPPGGDVPDSPHGKQDYYDTLFHSTAAVGVNTSALLEAAIVDKPCVTVMTPQYRKTQSEMPHFHHLLDANFLEIAHSFSEAAAILGSVLRGVDSKAANRCHFVRDFIRPWGMERTASEVMADCIEGTALQKSVVQLGSERTPSHTLPSRNPSRSPSPIETQTRVSSDD